MATALPAPEGRLVTIGIEVLGVAIWPTATQKFCLRQIGRGEARAGAARIGQRDAAALVDRLPDAVGRGQRIFDDAGAGAATALWQSGWRDLLILLAVLFDPGAVGRDGFARGHGREVLFVGNAGVQRRAARAGYRLRGQGRKRCADGRGLGAGAALAVCVGAGVGAGAAATRGARRACSCAISSASRRC